MKIGIHVTDLLNLLKKHKGLLNRDFVDMKKITNRILLSFYRLKKVKHKKQAHDRKLLKLIIYATNAEWLDRHELISKGSRSVNNGDKFAYFIIQTKEEITTGQLEPCKILLVALV